MMCFYACLKKLYFSAKIKMLKNPRKTGVARVLRPETIGEKFINLTGFVKILLGTVLFQEIHMMETIFGVFGVLESCFWP